MVISNLKIFIWGGGLSGLKFQKAPFWRIWTKISCFRSTVQKPACASQTVSHILRMWRLINHGSNLNDSVNLHFFSHEMNLFHTTFGINSGATNIFSINTVSHEITSTKTFNIFQGVILKIIMPLIFKF